MKVDEGRLSGFITLASFTLVAAILFFAKVVFVPIAVATLLVFLLAPLAIRLQRWHFPRPVALCATVAVAFGVIGFLAWLVTAQLFSLATELPRYEQTLRTKVQQLRGVKDGPSLFSKAGELVDSLKQEFETAPTNGVPKTTTNRTAAPGESQKPVPVEVKEARPSGLTSLSRVAGPFLSTLGTGGIVAVIVVFMLFQREDLRERFIRLVSGGKLNVATEAIDDAAGRISRYLVMQLVVNATYGLPIGIGLYFIGVPNALLWGLLATLLRFIPFLGPWIAAAFPVALAFAVDPGWSKLMMTIGLFLVVELVSNNLIEPWLYGASTGVSNVALIIAAVFWTWLWGPIGLLLSTPMTVCLVVLGKYVPGLEFLSVLLGSAPALQPHERLYQRMLAMDADEMVALGKEYIEKHELVEFYDQVVIPALNAAEEDRHNGTLAEVRQKFILQNTLELVDELGHTLRIKSNLPPLADGPARVLVVPAKDDVDEVAGMILIQALALDGIRARIMGVTALPTECAALAARGKIELVCVSAVPPAALYAARQVCRQLNDQCPGIKTLAGIWSPKAAVTELQQRLAGESPATVVTTIQEARRQIQGLLQPNAGKPIVPAPVEPAEAEILAEVERLQLGNREPNEMLDAVTRELARVFDVPISLVSIVDTDPQFWKSHVQLPHGVEAASEASRETSACANVVTNDGPLVVEDVTKDKRFADSSLLESRGIRFYAGVPLRSRAGNTVGSLCVVDTKPRQATEREIRLLLAIADKLMEAIEERCLQPAEPRDAPISN